MYARATGQTNLRETASFLFFVLRPQPTCGFLPSTFVAPTQSPRMQDVRAAPHADDAVLRNMSLLLGLTGSPGYQVDAASSPTFTSRMTLETAELARRRAMEGPPVVIVVNLPSSPPRTNLSPQRSRATYQEQGTLRPDDGIADYARDFMGSLSATLATASSATTAGAAAAGANTVAATASLAAMPAAGPTQAPASMAPKDRRGWFSGLFGLLAPQVQEETTPSSAHPSLEPPATPSSSSSRQVQVGFVSHADSPPPVPLFVSYSEGAYAKTTIAPEGAAASSSVVAAPAAEAAPPAAEAAAHPVELLAVALAAEAEETQVDDAAAEIQVGAAAYLLRKRAERKEKDALPLPEGAIAFEALITRTPDGSIGLSIDSIGGVGSVSGIVPGGAADQSRCGIQLGDLIYGVNNVVHSTAEAVLRALRVCRNEPVLRLGIIRPPLRTLLTGQAHVQLHQEWEGGRSVDHGVCEVTVNSDRTINIMSADANGVTLRHVFELQKMIEMRVMRQQFLSVAAAAAEFQAAIARSAEEAGEGVGVGASPLPAQTHTPTKPKYDAEANSLQLRFEDDSSLWFTRTILLELYTASQEELRSWEAFLQSLVLSKREAPPEPDVHCDKGHVLARLTAPPSYGPYNGVPGCCDVCGATPELAPGYGFQFHCRMCNYDMCSKCMSEQKPPRKTMGSWDEVLWEASSWDNTGVTADVLFVNHLMHRAPPLSSLVPLAKDEVAEAAPFADVDDAAEPAPVAEPEAEPPRAEVTTPGSVKGRRSSKTWSPLRTLSRLVGSPIRDPKEKAKDKAAAILQLAASNHLKRREELLAKQTADEESAAGVSRQPETPSPMTPVRAMPMDPEPVVSLFGAVSAAAQRAAGETSEAGNVVADGEASEASDPSEAIEAHDTFEASESNEADTTSKAKKGRPLVEHDAAAAEDVSLSKPETPILQSLWTRPMTPDEVGARLRSGAASPEAMAAARRAAMAVSMNAEAQAAAAHAAAAVAQAAAAAAAAAAEVYFAKGVDLSSSPTKYDA